MAGFVKDNVVGFDVTMDIVKFSMNVVYRLDKLRYIETRFGLRECILAHEMRH